MGEPLQNMEALLPALNIICHPLGLHFGAARVSPSYSPLIALAVPEFFPCFYGHLQAHSHTFVKASSLTRILSLDSAKEALTFLYYDILEIGLRLFTV